MNSVLVVDDDRSVRYMVQASLSALPVNVTAAACAEDGLRLVSECQPDVVLLDITLPGRSGLEIVREIQAIDRQLPIIIVTTDANSSTAIEAMNLGAYDYIVKPLDLLKISVLVNRALMSRQLMSLPAALTPNLDSAFGDQAFVGCSPQILDVFKTIGRVAAQDVHVLIRGESGTGKELVAHALHRHSGRSQTQFMAINCAALPDTLLESELFGHEKGSFTGADSRRIGKFEQCHGGTIFLDEIGDMALGVQSKVLRLLQDQRFERVGGNETICTDVRIISATNRPLEEMVEQKAFRADLLYRLNGMTITLPPLRERRSDIPLLLKHFLAQSRTKLNKDHIKGLSPECLEILSNYDWPGNVREMQSIVQQAMLNSIGTIIIPEFLPREVTARRTPKNDVNQRGVQQLTSAAGPTPKHGNEESAESLAGFIERRLIEKTTNLSVEVVGRVERYLYTRVLEFTNGKRSLAAEILGVTRGTVRDRIAAFDLRIESTVQAAEIEMTSASHMGKSVDPSAVDHPVRSSRDETSVRC